MINFISDNASGAHPAVLDAFVKANVGSALPYGDDMASAQAEAAFQKLFGKDIAVFFVMNGTGANVLALQSLTRSYHAVICSECAHIFVDETGAPENITGCKLLTIPSEDGKLHVKDIAPLLHAQGVVHHSQPKVISITQVTEMGALYSVEEIRTIAEFAHSHGMYLHMDGARIANAAAALGVPVHEFTCDAGVDVLSFGGAKNGMAFGEAVIFFTPGLSEGFSYFRKQNLQLLSKMRYLGSQFCALLEENLWLTNAQHANAMAKRLANGMQKMEHVHITNAVDANMVFAIMKPEHIAALQKDFHFYEWDEQAHEVRLVCSFNTTQEEVDAFLHALQGVE